MEQYYNIIVKIKKSWERPFPKNTIIWIIKAILTKFIENWLPSKAVVRNGLVEVENVRSLKNKVQAHA